MQSFLITGGTKKERDERAKKEGQVENINTRLMEISDCEKQTIGIEKVRELKKFLETKKHNLHIIKKFQEKKLCFYYHQPINS